MILKKTISALLVSAVAIFASDFKEGVNYKTLEQPLKIEKGTVLKIWSFTCPFCYKYDKTVTEKVMMESNSKFEAWHLSSKGRYGKQASNLMAVAQIKDISLKKDIFDKDSYFKKLKFAYYKLYHDKKVRWDKGEDEFYKEGINLLGLDKTQFEKELKNEKVQELVNKWNNAYYIAKIQGIPAFVVNGKYLILTQKIKSRDYMVKLIKYLKSK